MGSAWSIGNSHARASTALPKPLERAIVVVQTDRDDGHEERRWTSRLRKSIEFLDGVTRLTRASGARQRIPMAMQTDQAAPHPTFAPQPTQRRPAPTCPCSIDEAEHRMSHSKVRIKFECSLELQGGVVIPSGHVQNDTEVDLRTQRQRVETDRALSERKALLVFPV